ncbi:MAG: hypothetical protein ABSF18_01720 [Gammaproteobacteria bacterium]|jgi:hypothetical protein
MSGETLLERQKSQTTGNVHVHYDYQITTLQSQIDFKQLHLNKLVETQQMLDEGSAIIARETQKNQNLMDHQWLKIVKGFGEVPAQDAQQLLILSEDDEPEDEVMNEAQSFARTLKQLPQLRTIFDDYLDLIANINTCFNQMAKTDACFINKDTPNEKISILNKYKEKLQNIITDLEALKDQTPQSSPSFFYVDGMLNANIAALSYVDQFFENRKLIDDTRIRLANETVDNNGLREKLSETRQILEAQANELKQQIAAHIQQAEQARRQQEDNRENNGAAGAPAEKKNPFSSSATSSTTLPLAQRAVNIQQGAKPALVTATEETLEDLEQQVFQDKRPTMG